MREFLQERFGLLLGRTACIDWLHRLGFVRKRPGKRLLKADAEKRTAFVAEYQGLRSEAKGTGAKIFFVDEAHFRADVELRQMWSLRGKPAWVDSTSPPLGRKRPTTRRFASKAVKSKPCLWHRPVPLKRLSLF